MELDRPITPFTHRMQEPVGTDASVEEVLARALALPQDEQAELLCAAAALVVPRLEEENARSFVEGLRQVPEAHAELAPPEDTRVWSGSMESVLEALMRQAVGAQARLLHHLGTRIMVLRSPVDREGLLQRIERAIEAAMEGETPSAEAFQERQETHARSRVASRHEGKALSSHATFLKRVEEHTGLSRSEAEMTAVTTLCALDRRMLPGEAKDLDSQLPATFRDMLQRCHLHKDEKPRRILADEFLRNVADDIGCEPAEAEQRVRGVFAALRDQLSDGEIEDVIGQLPMDMKELFRAPA